MIRTILNNVDRFAVCLYSGFIAYFAPIWVNVSFVAFFIFVDTILGYRVSRLFGKKQIESRRLWGTIAKATEAALLIVGAHIIDTSIVTSVNLHAVEFVSGVICCTEFVSWLESLKALHPNNLIVKIVYKVFGDVIKSKSEKYLGTKIDVDELLNDNKNVT